MVMHPGGRGRRGELGQQGWLRASQDTLGVDNVWIGLSQTTVDSGSRIRLGEKLSGDHRHKVAGMLQRMLRKLSFICEVRGQAGRPAGRRTGRQAGERASRSAGEASGRQTGGVWA